MITYAVAFAVALGVAAICTHLVRDWAIRRRWFDQSGSSRKVHSAPIPRLGGVAIVLAFFAPLTALLVVDSGVGRIFRSHPDLIWGLFLGGLVIAALGLFDDLKGADARKKFTVQFLVAFALYAAGFRIDTLANPFGHSLVLGWLGLPLTLLWIVGVVNAMNLIDGLDGLAGGVAFFAIATLFVLAAAGGDVLMCLMMAALGGAVLGFLVYNFNPASIFMGDTGSMFLGFVLAAVSIKTSTKSGTAVALLVPIVALGLPITDTLLAMARRKLLGRPMFSADKEHIHHRLIGRFRLSHRAAVLVLYGVCCLFTLFALGLAFAHSPLERALVLGGLVVVVFAVMRTLGFLSLRSASAVPEIRRRNVQLRLLVKRISEQLSRAGSFEALWDAVLQLAEPTGADFRMRIDGTGLRPEGLTFEVGVPTPSDDAPRVELELRVGARRLGSLSAQWDDGRSEIDRDEERALEAVASDLGRAMARLMAPPAHESVELVAGGSGHQTL